MEHPALPNLLIIGAGKCGTTSLHRYLALHPEVHMSEPKELAFFLDPECLEKLDTYATFFDAAARVRGESSGVYTLYPLAPGVPDRIRAAIPDVKLLYLVREPVGRTVSDYLEARSLDREFRSFEDAVIGRIEDPYNPYIAAGRYATQLEPFARLFQREQMLVIDQVDLLARRRETLQRIFRFLGVNPAFESPRFEELANPREAKRRRMAIGRSLRYGRLANAIRRLPRHPRTELFRVARRITSRKLSPPAIDENAQRHLRDLFREEVHRLGEMTGQSFAWEI